MMLGFHSVSLQFWIFFNNYLCRFIIIKRIFPTLNYWFNSISCSIFWLGGASLINECLVSLDILLTDVLCVCVIHNPVCLLGLNNYVVVFQPISGTNATLVSIPDCFLSFEYTYSSPLLLSPSWNNHPLQTISSMGSSVHLAVARLPHLVSGFPYAQYFFPPS